jgi:hypothetical protein
VDTIDQVIAVIEVLLRPNFLTAVQELVLRQSWLGVGYEEMSEPSNYDADYLRNVGSKLWQTLSEVLGQRVTKNNFRAVLRQWLSDHSDTLASTSPLPFPLPEFPDSPAEANSPFYVERPPLEVEAAEAVLRPGALLCIKAPQRMGKTSLVLQTLRRAESQGYRVARINLRQADSTVLENLGQFLRWFCINLARKLNLEPRLDDYWENHLGDKVSCTIYIQDYILAKSDQPLVLALDEVSHLFEYPVIAHEFLPLLRFWHEESKNMAVWEKLHLIIAHSTDCYIPLNISQSPFNVGLSLQLQQFTPDQVLDLAHRYGLLWQPIDVNQLMGMIGGHPYLIRLALYYLVRGQLSLEQLLQQAPTQSGIYNDHLQSYLVALRQRPELSSAFQQVLNAEQPIQIDTIAAFKLYRMGLVDLVDDLVFPSCPLIRLYFRDRLTAPS